MPFAHHFVLLRHGQSQWNLENRFTGWTDVPLTEKGRLEAERAARQLQEAGLTFDLVFTSVLGRAVETSEIVLDMLGLKTTPIRNTWRLNERHYGDLQGLNKTETAKRLGIALVMGWRRSYSDRPPALEMDDHRHPRFDDRYSSLKVTDLPRTESLEDTEMRLLPYWENTIRPAICSGKRVLVAAHGNSLRALVRFLERIPVSQVPTLVIPTGIPMIYETDPEATIFQRSGASVRSG